MPASKFPSPGPKVFGLGLNKTGTSTLKTALETLGYDVAGPSKSLTAEVLAGRTDSALAMIERHDAFEDLPWPFLLEPVFSRFGTTVRYILTVRKDTQAWLRSMKNHVLQRQIGKILNSRSPVYGSASPFGFESEYIRFYESHNARVRQFFVNQGAEHVLFELCWEHGAGWAELCNFLDQPVPDAPFPHSNATAGRNWRIHRQFANGLAAHALARLNGRRIADDLFRVPPRLAAP